MEETGVKPKISPVDRLEDRFQSTARGQAGPCPLPEPGDRPEGHGLGDDFVVEHAGHIDERPQPKSYDYDREELIADTERFASDLLAYVEQGDMQRSEARDILVGELDLLVQSKRLSRENADKMLERF